MLEKKIDAHEIMYGVNTGIGEFSEVVLDNEKIKDFQKYLIYNHAAGIGGVKVGQEERTIGVVREEHAGAPERRSGGVQLLQRH